MSYFYAIRGHENPYRALRDRAVWIPFGTARVDTPGRIRLYSRYAVFMQATIQDSEDDSHTTCTVYISVRRLANHRDDLDCIRNRSDLLSTCRQRQPYTIRPISMETRDISIYRERPILYGLSRRPRCLASQPRTAGVAPQVTTSNPGRDVIASMPRTPYIYCSFSMSR